MAWRMYEMNVLLRFQDRGSARLRRLAQDFKNVSAASMQREATNLQTRATRELEKQQNLRSKLSSMTRQDGINRLSYESKIARLQAAEIEARKAAAVTRGGASITPAELRLLSIEKEILATEKAQNLAKKDLRAQIKLATLAEAEFTRQAELSALAAKKAARIESLAVKGRTISHVGAVATMTGGLGVLVAGGLASGYATFNRETGRAATQLRAVNESYAVTLDLTKRLETVILGMSRTFPASTTEMASSAYELASGLNFVHKNAQGAFVPLETGAQRLKATTQLLAIANRVAVAGGIDLKSATESMIITLNNFVPHLDDTQGSAHRVWRAMNTLFATVKYGKGTFDQFSPVFGRMSIAARMAGQQLVEAGGAVAFLSTRLGSQSQAVTGYVRLMQIMQRPEFVAGFKALTHIDVRVPGTEKLRPLSQIIDIITGGGKGKITQENFGLMRQNLLQLITEAGQKSLGRNGIGLQSTQNARQALGALIAYYKDYKDILSNVRNNTDEFNQAFKAQMQQPGVRWQVAVNQFRAFAIVVGQDVLPVMLRFLDFLTGLAHRFEALNPHTRKMIASFAAWSAIILLVIGPILTLTGGLIRLSAGLIGFSGAAEGATTKSAKLLGVLRRLRLIGTIGIGIAITMYLTNKKFREQVQDEFYNLDKKLLNPHKSGPKVTIGGKDYYLKDQTLLTDLAKADMATRAGSKEREKLAKAAKNKIPRTGEDVVRGIEPPAKKPRTLKPSETAKALALSMMGQDVVDALNKRQVVVANNIQVNLAKALSSGNKAQIRKAYKDLIAFDEKAIAPLQKLHDSKKISAAQEKQLIALYNNETQAKSALEAMTNKETAAQTKAQKAAERLAKQHETLTHRVETAKTKVEDLTRRIQQLNQENLQRLQSAFGSLFQGPIMQGPLAQAFANINSTLQGVGAKPIPIPISLTLQDQATQQANFDQLNKDLANLVGRVVKAAPKGMKQQFGKEFTDEILGLGTGALPMLEGVLHGTPTQQRQFINNFIKGQESINKAQSQPWNIQLKAANLQMQAAKAHLAIAQGRLKDASKDLKATPTTTKSTVKPVSGTTRTTQAHTTVIHNDHTTIHADGASQAAIERALAIKRQAMKGYRAR